MKLASLLLLLPLTATATPISDATEALESNHPDTALTLTNQILDKNPADPEALLLRARAHEQKRDFPSASTDYKKVIDLLPSAQHLWVNVGMAEFRAARIPESLAAFDKAIAANPRAEPYLWQRGIALYYAGEFEKAAKQFELHRTVNPDDVENAAWHFLCVARWKSVEEARKSLIPINSDDRVPMMQIHALFAGKSTQDDVLRAAESNHVTGPALNHQRLYAHLYLALYEEAQSHPAAAKDHLTKAVTFAADDYMSDVARIHLKLLESHATTAPSKK